LGVARLAAHRKLIAGIAPTAIRARESFELAPFSKYMKDEIT